MKASYTEDYDKVVMDAIKQASEEVTDDCMYEGVITLGAILLGIDEDELRDVLERG